MLNATAIPRSFEVTVNLNMQLPQNFRLLHPDIILSGIECRQPTVEFSRTVGPADQGVPP